MGKKRFPLVYFDEHIHPGVVQAFRDQKYKCILVANTKYRGKDEKDYIGRVRSEGALFVTSDARFVRYVEDNKTKHAGIIWVPNSWDDETLSFASEGMAGLIRGFIDIEGRRFLYDCIFYIADDGYHYVRKGIDKLEYSIGKLEIDLDL